MQIISPTKFLFLRLILSIYLIYFFSGLWSHADIIFSTQGLFPAIHPWFPLNFVLFFKKSSSFQTYLSILMLISLILNTKYYKITAFLLWIGWISLLSRIPFFIPPPNIGYLGFLLLILTQIDYDNNKYIWPNWFKQGLWLVLGATYSASGIGKLLSTTWQDGLSLITTLNAPFSQSNWFTQYLIESPIFIQKTLSYFVLSAEVLFLPLVLWPKTRLFALTGMTLTHLGILSMLNIHDIPLGLLIFHILFIEEKWFKPKNINIEFYGTSSIINFLKNEDFYGTIKLHPSSNKSKLIVDGKEINGWLSVLISLSYTNGFWYWLRPFKYVRIYGQ